MKVTRSGSPENLLSGTRLASTPSDRRVGRRSLLAGGAALASVSWLGMAGCGAAQAHPRKAVGLPLGPRERFSYDRLIEQARRRAERAYVPPKRPAPALVAGIDYAAHGQLKYKREAALFADQAGAHPVTFFHLGMLFPKTVRMHVVTDGTAQVVRYDPRLFDMPVDAAARNMPSDAGFAGFRLHEETGRPDWPTQDWLAFLGAAYFRSIGAQGQYGLSARGVAVNTTAPGLPEEFPDFTDFYIAPSKTVDGPTMVYALLDGPSLTGAFAFACVRSEGVRMEVRCELFLRSDIAQLGVAPLTSMFWYSEYDKPFRGDWRPEVHDSDGLSLWTGSGERIFRPLGAPERVVTSSFVDASPRGFGLMQRDRDYAHYLDGVHYERRPSLWIEPLEDFGEGAVQLIEIPTVDEYHDNVVAFFSPQKPTRRGDHLRYRYRMYWEKDQPGFPANLAKVSATRVGRMVADDLPPRLMRFVIEFAGAGAVHGLQPKLTASGGALRGEPLVERVGVDALVRVQFDWVAPETDRVELTLKLLRDGRAVSETWAHQFAYREC